ncbi:MAG: DUF502 domain-containing protein [bacterium]
MLKTIRNYFVAGLLILTPLVVTWLIIQKLFFIVDQVLREHLKAWLNQAGLPYISGYGFIAVIIIILLTGIIGKNYFGKRLFNLAEKLLKKIPIINKIYIGIQQISNAFMAQNKKLFSHAVLFEYPKKGSYVIGFVTRDITGEIRDRIGEETYSIFVPTTPNPTSGFLLFVPKKEVISLNISVEDAVKLIMSGGMVTPEEQTLTEYDLGETSLLKKIIKK